jgi:hypothetical protein
MSQNELRAASVIDQVIARAISGVEAAASLGVTDRTVRRMRNKVIAGGAGALAHRGRGRSGNRRIPDDELSEMRRLLRERYPDFKPGFAAEKLREGHGIDRDPKTVRSVMIGLGLWQPDRRKRTEHRQWRERRPRYGDMEQYDGSYDHWLEDRGGTGEMCLVASVDDATGRATHAMFVAHEGVLPTMAFWREYAEKNGLPGSIYADRFSTYKLNHGLAAENADARTQFGRACAALGVALIFAQSPQAKGRIERFFETCQDRLIKEMRLRGISTVDDANRYLREEFLPDYNRRFGRPAREPGDAHRPPSAEERRRLPLVLCREEERTLTADFTIPHGKAWYQTLPSPNLALRPKDKVLVRTAPDGTVTLWVRNKPVNFRLIEKGRDILASLRKRPNRTFLIPPHPDISISR